MNPLGPGSTIDGFLLEEQIGQGGMGLVFRARDTRLDRTVAIKLIHSHLSSDPEFRTRFEDEIRISASIDHPNVIPVFQAGEADGHLYIAMRHVQGTSLAQRLRREGSLPLEETLEIGRQIASALDEAHVKGLVHRDVKPANILLAEGTGHAYLTDFGIARAADSSSLTTTGRWIGAVRYAAPEQFAGGGGQIDARTDIYALATVMYECLTGALPFESDSDLSLMWEKANSTPAPPSERSENEIPPAVDEALLRALDKDPDARFQTAGGFLRSMEADGDLPGHGGRSGRGGRARHQRNDLRRDEIERQDGRWRGPLVWVLIGLAVAGAMVLGYSLAVNSDQPGDGTAGRETTANAGETGATGRSSGERGRDSGDQGPGAAAGLVAVEQELFSAEVPAGWVQEEDDEDNGDRLTNRWRNPDDPDTYVLVDAQTPRVPGTPAENAESVRAQTSQTSGYEEREFAPITLSGEPALRWRFDLPEDRRVDYFFNRCDTSFAVLGVAGHDDFDEFEGTFRQVAQSIQANC